MKRPLLNPSISSASHFRVFAIRIVIAVGVFCLALAGSAVNASASTLSNGHESRPWEVTQATGAEVVLKWKARSSSDNGQWRIYRSTNGQQFKLADTIAVIEGVQHYRFSDMRLQTRIPSQIYELRYCGSDGRETVVAIARCSDSGLEDTPVAPSTYQIQTAELVSENLIGPMMDQRLLPTPESESWEWHAQPEFPPPRLS